MNTPTAQDEHQAATVGCSQKDRLLARLLESPGQWVPMPELARVMSTGGDGTGVCVSRRIYDLRNAGHDIQQCDEHEGHIRKSFYKLILPHEIKTA
jgi:hypothetical protein